MSTLNVHLMRMVRRPIGRICFGRLEVWIRRLQNYGRRNRTCAFQPVWYNNDKGYKVINFVIPFAKNVSL